MNEPEPVTPAVESAPPLTATLAEIVGTGTELSLSALRKARESGTPVEAPAAPPAAVTAEPATVEPGTAEPAKVEVKPDPASEAGKTLAAHKSGLEKRKTSIQTEIDALTHDKHATRRDVEAARADLEAVRREIAAAKGGTPPAAKAPARTDAEPQEEAFEHYRDYVKAQARWEARQEIATARAETDTHNVEQAKQAALTRVYAKGHEAHQDFDAVLTGALDAGVQWSPFVTRVVFSHPEGHRIAYELAKDPALSASLSAMRDPVQFGIALAPLLTRLSAATIAGPAETAKPVSKAQDPPKPVGAAPTASLPSMETAVAGTEISLKRLRQIKEARGGR